MRQTRQAPRGHRARRGQASPAASPAGVSVSHAGPSTILSPLATVQATSSGWEEGRPAVPACSGVGGTGGHSWRNPLPPQTSPKSPCRCPLSRGRTLCSSPRSYQENYNSSDGEGTRGVDRLDFTVTLSSAGRAQPPASALGGRAWAAPALAPWAPPPPRVKFPLVVRGKSASF